MLTPSKRLARILAAGYLVAASTVVLAAQGGAPPLSAPDERAIRETLERYRLAWLANDSAAVLDTFEAQAVLLPSGGAAPALGRAAILEYWWPKQRPPTTIVRFAQPVASLAGSGSFASARGTSVVEWTSGADSAKQTSHSLWSAVLRKGPEGSWKIRMLAWDSLP